MSDVLNKLLTKQKINRTELLKIMNNKNKAQIEEIFKKGKISKTELTTLLDPSMNVSEQIVTEPVKNILHRFKLNKLFVFKALIFIIFITSLIMTITYNYIGFLKIMEPFKAFISAITFVGCLLICIETILFIGFNKNIKTIWKIFVNSLLSVIIILIFIIIMNNILVSQFDYFQNNMLKEKVEYGDNNYELKNNYEIELKQLTDKLKSFISERDRRQTLLNALTPQDKSYVSLYSSLYGIKGILKDIDNVENDLKSKRDQINKLLTDNKITQVRKTTLYDYLNKYVFKGQLNIELLQFLQMALPALIFDIISSLSLGLIFFLRED